MMLEKLTTREQVLIFIVVSTFVLGAYGLIRFIPESKKLAELSQTLEKNKETIKNPKFPDEPSEDVDDLTEKAEELGQALNDREAILNGHEQQLAPTGNQDMVLKISEAARAAGVKVVESVPYIVQSKDGETANAANKPKLGKRKQRRLEQEARRKARKQGNTQQASSTFGTIPKEGELIYHLVNDLEKPRPLQRISVEGNFANLQKFIQSVRAMPWQATIVKLDIDVSIQTPPPGVPQPIMTRMIIAM